MRTPASSFTLVLAAVTMFTAGCRDEVSVTLDEIEATQQEILALLEQRVAFPPGEVAAAAAAEQNARTALENAGLVLNDHGDIWWSKPGVIACSAWGLDRGPLCTAWQEAHDLKSRHEDAQRTVNNRANRYAQRLEALQRAREDDTWDVLEPFNPSASGRSIVITYLRELEDELENERARLQSTTDAPTR